MIMHERRGIVHDQPIAILRLAQYDAIGAARHAAASVAPQRTQPAGTRRFTQSDAEDGNDVLPPVRFEGVLVGEAIADLRRVGDGL